MLRAKVRQAEAELSRKPARADLQRDRDLERLTGVTPSRTTTTKRD